MKPRALRLSLFAAMCVSLSCSRPPKFPITDPAMALRRVRERDQRVRQLRAHGSADHFGAQGRIRGEVYVFVDRPSNVRVDTRAFGNTVSSLVTDGQHIAMTDFRNGQFYIGPAQACIAAQLLGVPMEAAEVVALLAGGPPLYGGNAHIRWDDGHYVVDVEGEGGRRESIDMEITSDERENARPEQQHPRPVRAEMRDGQGVRAVLTFEDYTDIEGVPFPRRVRVVMERANVDLVVRYREVSLDPDLPEDAFVLTPPSTALEVVPVSCDRPLAPPAPETDAGARGASADATTAPSG